MSLRRSLNPIFVRNTFSLYTFPLKHINRVSTKQIRHFSDNLSSQSVSTQNASKPQPIQVVRNIDNFKAINRGSLSFRSSLPWYKRLVGRHSLKDSTYFTAKQLYKTIDERVCDPAWNKVYKSDDSFHDWFMLSMLHVWMLLVRLRPDTHNALTLTDAVFDNYWTDVERRMIAHDIGNPLIFSKNMKIYSKFYYGSVVSYDEGLVGSDAVLADALYRNLLAMDESADAGTLLKLVQYVRTELHTLAQTPTQELFDGRFQFSNCLEQLAQKPN